MVAFSAADHYLVSPGRPEALDQLTILAAVATATEGQVRLTWTAPDEDLGASAGEEGSSYILRISTNGAADFGNDTNAWWAQAATVASPPRRSCDSGSRNRRTVSPTITRSSCAARA